jgi:hypothetical protein
VKKGRKQERPEGGTKREGRREREVNCQEAWFGRKEGKKEACQQEWIGPKKAAETVGMVGSNQRKKDCQQSRIMQTRAG